MTTLMLNDASLMVPSERILVQALELNPYNEAIYRLWLQKFGDTRGELEALESFFGISVSSNAKQDLIDARKATLDFSTTEACDTSLAKLTAYAHEINYRELDKESAQDAFWSVVSPEEVFGPGADAAMGGRES